jgi:hypothetical protein
MMRMEVVSRQVARLLEVRDDIRSRIDRLDFVPTDVVVKLTRLDDVIGSILSELNSDQN